MQKEKRLINNVLWFAIGSLSSKIISFLLLPFYTNILSLSEYSVSDLISTTINLLCPIFTVTITEAVMRFALDKANDKKQVFSVAMWIVFIGTILAGIISFVLFPIVTNNKIYWWYFYGWYIVHVLYSLESEFLKGLERVRLLAVANAVHTLLFAVCCIISLSVLKIGIAGYIMSYILSYGISCVILFIGGNLSKYIISLKSVKMNYAVQMVRYSIPMIPNSLMWWINNSADRYMVAMMISSAMNGLLAVAYKIPSLLMIIIGIFMNAWQVSVVEDFENEKGKQFFNIVYQKFVEINILGTSFLICCSKLLGKILYSADFFEAWKLSVILIIGFSMHSLSGFLGTVYTTVKNTKKLFISTMVGAVFNIILNFILLYFIGVMGAAVATLFSYFVVFVVRRIDVRKYIKIECNSLRYIISYVLILAQALCLIETQKYMGFISYSVFVLQCIINRKSLNNLVVSLKNRIVKKQNALEK